MSQKNVATKLERAGGDFFFAASLTTVIYQRVLCNRGWGVYYETGRGGFYVVPGAYTW